MDRLNAKESRTRITASNNGYLWFEWPKVGMYSWNAAEDLLAGAQQIHLWFGFLPYKGRGGLDISCKHLKNTEVIDRARDTLNHYRWLDWPKLGTYFWYADVYLLIGTHLVQ